MYSSSETGSRQAPATNGQLLTALGGAGLAFLGLRRGGLIGLGLAIGGGALAARTLGGSEGMRWDRARETFRSWERRLPTSGPVAVQRSLTIERPRSKVYEFVSDFTRFPRFMSHVEDVTARPDGTWHWQIRGPAGMILEWDSELTADITNERLAWRSLPGADVPNEGELRFEDTPGGPGTSLHLELVYDPPGGAIGRAVAWLMGEEPDLQARDDLRRLKQLLETGEDAASEADGSRQG